MLALICHPVLDGNATAERLHALDVVRRDRLRVIEEPAQLVDRHVTVHAFEHVEKARD